MAWSNVNQSRSFRDRFGNPQMLVRMYEHSSKNGFTCPRGYAKVGSKLIRFEVTPAKGDKTNSKGEIQTMWLSIVSLSARSSNASVPAIF